MSDKNFGAYFLRTVFTAVMGSGVSVIKTEVERAKEETSAKLKKLGLGIFLVCAALTVAYVALLVLLAAAVAGLSEAWPVWLSALVIGGFLLLVGAIIAAMGAKKIKKNKDLMPDRAIRNIRDAFNK